MSRRKRTPGKGKHDANEMKRLLMPHMLDDDDITIEVMVIHYKQVECFSWFGFEKHVFFFLKKIKKNVFWPVSSLKDPLVFFCLSKSKLLFCILLDCLSSET